MSEKELSQEEMKVVNSADNEDEDRFLGYMRAAAILATAQCGRSVEKMRDIFDEHLSQYCQRFKSPINIKNIVGYVFKKPQDNNPAFHEIVTGAKLYSVEHFCRINNANYLFHVYPYPETPYDEEENMALEDEIDTETLNALMDAVKAEITGESEKEKFIKCVKAASKAAFGTNNTSAAGSCRQFMNYMYKLLIVEEIRSDRLCVHVRCHSREDEYTYFNMFSRGSKYEMSCEYGGYSENYFSYHAYLFG